jgi:four helix bundle protein
MQIESYQDLRVWKEGIAISLRVYKLTGQFPDHEKFGLVSQMRRCAVSIPSNIAEGHARLSTREYIRHLSISLGSLAELETQIHLAEALGYACKDTTVEILAKADQLGKQIRTLTKSLKSRLNEANRKFGP